MHSIWHRFPYSWKLSFEMLSILLLNAFFFFSLLYSIPFDIVDSLQCCAIFFLLSFRRWNNTTFRTDLRIHCVALTSHFTLIFLANASALCLKWNNWNRIVILGPQTKHTHHREEEKKRERKYAMTKRNDKSANPKWSDDLVAVV